MKESHTISAQTEDTFKTNALITELYSRLVDPNRTIRSEPHDDGFRRISHNRRTCRLGQARLEPLLPVRNDHENDQEHQQNIDQRNYVDIGNDSARTAQKDNRHGSPRSWNFPCEEDTPVFPRENG